MMIKSFETETIRCINGELLFSNDKLFVLVVCLNDIQNFPMCYSGTHEYSRDKKPNYI